MKVTVSAAMRARDVSRPRDEQVAEAEAAEAGVPSGPRANVTAAGAARGDERGARDAELKWDGTRAMVRDGEVRAGTRPDPQERAGTRPDPQERAGTRPDPQEQPEGTRKRKTAWHSARRGRAGR
jgi:hypothetical protein